jgi:hypothetical protein
MNNMNPFLIHLPSQLFLQNETEIVQELLTIKEKMQYSSPYFRNNSAFTGGTCINNLSSSSFVSLQNIHPNPFQKHVDISFIEDPLIKKTGIPIGFLKKYPDSAREIALKYIKNPPELLFMHTQSNRSPKIISERTLYWMQIYGPSGNRFDHLQRCVSSSIRLIERFQQSPQFQHVAPVDHHYRALIPYILQSTTLEPLSLPLIHALSAYYHSRSYSRNGDSSECSHYSSIEDEKSEHSNGSSLQDNDEQNHPNQEPDDQMSDITSTATAGENGSAMENSSPVLHSNANQHTSNDNIDTEEEDHTLAEEHLLQNTNDNDSHLLEHCVNEMDVSSDQVNATQSTTEEKKETEENLWRNLVNSKPTKPSTNQIPRSIPNANEADLPNDADNGFKLFPNCECIYYVNPPCKDELCNDPMIAEFIKILQQLPYCIQKNLPQKQLYEIHERHCLHKPNEQDRDLVLIDGGRFEFYIRENNENENQSKTCNLMFDNIVMKPLLSSWLNNFTFQYIKSPNDFKKMLLKYISRCFDTSYKIHAVSFILDYPKTSEVRQWSHIDGYKNMFQGSVTCGNGTSATMEFPCFNPRINQASDLKNIWTFLPKENNVLAAMSGNPYCVDLINQYGTLLNHNAGFPLNPLSYQKAIARLSPDFKSPHQNSPFKAGTIFKMPGCTIHAGPESDKHNCRALFFYAASPPGCPQYDPSTQWNQVTLIATLLAEIWEKISPLERGYMLDYIRRIQSNSKIAPSDTSVFVGNYTLRLFVRVVLFLTQISQAYPKRQARYINFLQSISSVPHIQERKQFITKKMKKDLDDNLLDVIFMYDEEGSSKQIFHLK